MKKSLITMIVALCLVAALGVGATLAYLTSTTNTLYNKFEIGKVSIDLTEFRLEDNQRVEKAENATGFTYERIVPGATLSKIPVVTVKAKSEDCYLFVKIVNPNTTITVGDMSDGWTKLKDGVYYRTVEYSENDQAFDVFESVTVANVTVANGIIEGATFQDIEITAYAIQQLGFESAAAAYAQFE